MKMYSDVFYKYYNDFVRFKPLLTPLRSRCSLAPPAPRKGSR